MRSLQLHQRCSHGSGAAQYSHPRRSVASMGRIPAARLWRGTIVPCAPCLLSVVLSVQLRGAVHRLRLASRRLQWPRARLFHATCSHGACAAAHLVAAIRRELLLCTKPLRPAVRRRPSRGIRRREVCKHKVRGSPQFGVSQLETLRFWILAVARGGRRARPAGQRPQLDRSASPPGVPRRARPRPPQRHLVVRGAWQRHVAQCGPHVRRKQRLWTTAHLPAIQEAPSVGQLGPGARVRHHPVCQPSGAARTRNRRSAHAGD